MSKHGDAIIKLTADLDRTRKELDTLRGHACRNCGGFTNIQACSCDKNKPTDNVLTESVTQPRINFCYACGTALGVE